MDKTVQTNLCKGIRAIGIPKKQGLEILNIVEKWYRESGVEWTNSRIKDLRQWYETTLTGNPKAPEWFRHTKEGLPVGIWKWVFELPPAKALGVLSLNTCFYSKEFTQTQREKFLHGLAGNGSADPARMSEIPRSNQLRRLNTFKAMPDLSFPTVFDMTGSIPVRNGRSTCRPNEKLGPALEALRSSWESVPQVTFDFLDRMDMLSYMPMSVLGNKYQLELNRPHDRCVGRVGVIQQAQLKARTVGNPNRVTQVTLDPLKEVYMTTARKLPTDCTHDQESGVRWIQEQLRQGNELAGSDLTSASDLLEVGCCLNLVDQRFGFPEIEGYEEHRDYFLKVCRSAWWSPDLDCEVQWEQGDVLGTGPSFGLLTLTNNVLAHSAYCAARGDGLLLDTHWSDSFRVVGDDIVMRSEMEPYYTSYVEILGGEINHSKTLKSDKVAEFAGRVVTADTSYLKAIKYAEPSDNSFMEYMAQLGDQAKYFLRPKQRQVYDLFKEVPGIVVNGPWMRDSYGVPLSDRYQWYLEEVEPVLRTAEPDRDLKDYESVLLAAQLSLAEAGNAMDSDEREFDRPFIDEGYLPSQVDSTFRAGGDPRLTDGKSQLDVLHQHVADKDITSFEKWSLNQVDSLPDEGGMLEDPNVLEILAGIAVLEQQPQEDAPEATGTDEYQSPGSERHWEMEFDDLEL